MQADSREALLMAQALAFTIEGLKTLPKIERPDSNIRDMEKLLLEEFSPAIRGIAESELNRWLTQVGWSSRRQNI
jgi:hypothetical protein